MHSFSFRTSVRRSITVGAIGAAVLLTLTACGGGTDDKADAGSSASSPSASAAPAASGPHNAADVTFAKDMIPHHAQAVEMAGLATSTSTDAEIKTLAADITAGQQPEIRTLTGWLIGWQETVPSTKSGQMNMDMGSGAMPGMMSSAEMAKLEKATGAEFDKMWVEMMTKHHQGAIQMAQAELANGQNTEVKALANQVITAQTAEIAKMATISKRLG